MRGSKFPGDAEGVEITFICAGLHQYRIFRVKTHNFQNSCRPAGRQ